MANKERRGNREAKKPKQAKKPPPLPPSGFPAAGRSVTGKGSGKR